MSPERQLRETEDFLHRQIPITAAMGVRVESWDAGEQLTLTAPLGLNHNHLGTAFGGSLAAIATLAGYAFLWLELGDRAAHVVIAESSLAYRRPVKEEIRAICRRPEGGSLAAFKATFAQAGKARLRLDLIIENADGAVAVEFGGTFVARK